jgi:hypothetical protein
LIIDDGSTDDSMAVVGRYDDPRIRVEHNGHAQPGSGSRSGRVYRSPRQR